MGATVSSWSLLQVDEKDEELYPEYYRKSEYVKGSNMDVPKPFQIGTRIPLLSILVWCEVLRYVSL